MLLIHTARVVDVGIDFADIVKIPGTRTICEFASDGVEGEEYLCGTFCPNFVSSQQQSRTHGTHLHVGNFLVLVQEVVHVKFAR